MSRRIIVSVVGALAAASLAAPVAHAGAPAKVSVRIEAPGKTLADATLTTTRAKVVKDGTHSCTGTSAAGAIELATRGHWTGTWFNGLGYAVDTVEGVKPVGFTQYWALWINGKVSTTGVCDSELQPGDQVLEFICRSTPDFSSCTNLPLAMKAGTVHVGRVKVTVTRLNGDGTSTRVAGATVRGGAALATTGADGTAIVELGSQSALRATHPGNVPSARLHCVTGDGGGSCGSTDHYPPALDVRGIRDGQVFAAADAPRVLHGIARDPSGVTVALRLTRRIGTRCARFDADRARFRPCAVAPRGPFAVGDRARWSYLLPARLTPGAYTLRVRATDGAGNRLGGIVRFTVVAAG